MEEITKRILISIADENDRKTIYKLRHEVYATELGQHKENESCSLTDNLDEINIYIVAKVEHEIVGFISLTPPNNIGYSIDKYFSRDQTGLNYDQSLFEIRLLTVMQSWRGSYLAILLMKGAHRLIQSIGGSTIVAIGRLEVLRMYALIGLHPLGLRAKSGNVTYELMIATTDELLIFRPQLQEAISLLEKRVDWSIDNLKTSTINVCYHGGDFFEAIGDEFDNLKKREKVINADVLDAWFDPAPNVTKALIEYLPWILKTSPPTGNEGMVRKLAEARGVSCENILAGAGSSDLIFLGLRQWIKPDSTVLILDPMYGEYAHVLEKVIQCKVERLVLTKKNNFSISGTELSIAFQKGYDWVILVNPNSPTGQYFQGEELKTILDSASPKTKFWIDETYLEYVGQAESLEKYAVTSKNVIICKSLSKVFALSGARCAYLCGPKHFINELRFITPPWAVSLPGQIAVCEALKNPDYYRERWSETNKLREELADNLAALGWEVIPGCANFILCTIPSNQPEAKILIAECREWKLYLRNVENMGKCFDQRTLRIAVKDRETNLKMVSILREIIGIHLNNA